jgi:hypothetical protein
MDLSARVGLLGTASESIGELLAGLAQLQDLMGNVFGKISGKVEAEHERLDRFNERLAVCQRKVDRLGVERPGVATIVQYVRPTITYFESLKIQVVFL